MKWTALLKDFKEKVGFSQSPEPSPSSSYASTSLPFLRDNNAYDPASLPSSDRHELELDFKRCWEEFRSLSSEKEKEKALNLTLDIFCRLVNQQANVDQLLSMLVETHIFSFVVGRALVTDIEKLKLSSKTRTLEFGKVLSFFLDLTKDGVKPGANLLNAVKVIVSGLIDKQSLLDSGIFSCLISVLSALLNPHERKKDTQDETLSSEENRDNDAGSIDLLEVEGSVVHIMKALASHPGAPQSLIEDNALQLLFQMVADGSSIVFAKYKQGLVPLHTIQLHRHAMQILSLLLVNDNGSTTRYIRKHHLIKVLLMAVKDFNTDCGDSAYTMGIVDLLLECVELSCRPEAGGIRLREDIHNAHGYQYLVHFALVLSKTQGVSIQNGGGDILPPQNLSPTLSRLLDVLVSLSQAGPPDPSSLKKPIGHGRSRTSSFERVSDEYWEKDNGKVKDLEAVQMLQDIFLKVDNRELQAEVLNRMFKIFSSHIENYKLCQQLRTVPLLILNMDGFPSSLHEIILKILEYAVTVVNCIPEQELLSLCCLLQQPLTPELKHTVLSFFVKLLSFDQQYKKVLREVGLLEVLLDDLKQHKFLLGPDQSNIEFKERSGFKNHLDGKDMILTSPKPVNGRFSLFEVELTIQISWDCLVSLLKKAETNQTSFRSSNGVTIFLPFLASDVHRPGVLRVLSCLIIEDVFQAHPEELGTLIEILKSGMVTSALGSQYKLEYEAKCDTFGALWRILGVNSSAQRVFGEATGFSLLLTTLHSFQSDTSEEINNASSIVYIKVFTYLLRAIIAGVCDNAINRTKLHTIITSQTFYDLLSESGLICIDCERQVVQLMFELALEIVLPPFLTSNASDNTEKGSTSFILSTQSGSFTPNKERVYNASAVRVLIRALLLFTPKVQLEVLDLIEKLSRASSFNQENLTSVGCIELLLETIYPFLSGSSPLLSHALKIVEVLGAYRLTALELRVLVRYILQMRQVNSGKLLVDMMERLILSEDMGTEDVSLGPFVEMDMSKSGHASIQVPLGDRSWPPAAGYSFVCWFQYQNLLNEIDSVKTGSIAKRQVIGTSNNNNNVLRIFCVGSADNSGKTYSELRLSEDGVLTLATSNSSFLSFSGLEMDEKRWHHLAIVHSKPGMFQASVAYVYLNGKLRHTGRLGYSPSPAGKSLQVTIGTSIYCTKVSNLSWRLRSCYLFEEVLSPGSICFMYILGRGYRGLLQDTDMLRFIPNQACGGGSMAILDSLDSELPLTSPTQKTETVGKAQRSLKGDSSGFVWDLEKLGNLSLLLSGKKLICAFDGTSTELFRASGTISMLNLVDPLSASASPIGGIPRFGRPMGDIYVCKQCIIGETIRPIGGMTVILALIEAAETQEMLRMALTLLACALHQDPQNVRDMLKYRGYHLLGIFLQRKMSLFDMQSLEIFFKIAACEASFSEPKKLKVVSPGVVNVPETSFENLNLPPKFDEFCESQHGDMDDSSVPKDTLSQISELDNTGISSESSSNCIVLSNPDIVEHVLLDWTIWVVSPIPLQIALLGFLEHLVSMHWYQYHNLTILRRINLVQHLLVTLQRGDVEVPVLEKLVELLSVIIQDGFLPSELEHVVRFVIMTFDPPILTSRHQIKRESMGKHVIVRNMLLEMLIDLQVTITSEELLEQWHKIVSSKLITYFLDEALHPTSMRWVMTLLGVCLASSPTFALKFRSSGGYQGLERVLPSFYDSPDIYYILFCLIFGKPVYPRLPEVRMLDFHALMPGNDGNNLELKFVEVLECVIAMVKSTFDKLCMQSMIAHQGGNFAQVAELIEGYTDMGGELLGEALMHKTYAARLMGGEASAPAAATSVLRFMVDLAKMCPPFSNVCRRPELLESCIHLYFSCIRAAHAVKLVKALLMKNEEKTLNEGDETSTFTSISHDQQEQIHVSTSSEDIENKLIEPVQEQTKSVQKDEEWTDQNSTATSINIDAKDSHTSSSTSFNTLESPILMERFNNRISVPPVSSPVVALTSWLGVSTQSEHSVSTPSSLFSQSLTETESSSFTSLNQLAANMFIITPKLLLEVDDSGYGGGPCSAGAAAVLDFMAEVLSDIVVDQVKATPLIETILESVPLYVDAESVLVFQGLCLSRLMNFLEGCLLRDDEESEQKLDKNKWSFNLDALCWMIVDRVYMGAFPYPGAVLKTLEFLLSMLQLANKDGRIEEAAPGRGILSIGRGTRQLDAYMHALLKNMNRMILYCFLPSYLTTIGEDELLSCLNLQVEPKKGLSFNLVTIEDRGGVDISTVLQILVANIRIVFCPSNLDTDLNYCICINLIPLLRDQRQNAKNMSVEILKYFLIHRKAVLEDLLVRKPNQGPILDILHGGFEKLLTGSLSDFFDWFKTSEEKVNKVIEHCVTNTWTQYITGSIKFPGVRIKGMDSRRKREMSRKSKESSKLDSRHWEQVNERRIALEMVRDAMSKELRVVRQDKYGWVLHAESEWQKNLQELVHERGILPISKTSINEDLEWELCPIEGPYRMRKKLKRCKLKIDTIHNVLNGDFEDFSKEKENELSGSDSDSDPVYNLLTDNLKHDSFASEVYDEGIYNESYEVQDVASSQLGWNDDRDSSINEASLSFHSAAEFGSKSSSASIQKGESKSDLGSPMQSPSIKSEKEVNENGEYLIRPHLLPLEKIKYKYNCERVMGLDKHDGVFLIGELSLYVIENFYIDESGCICEKESEDDLSVIDQALGVKKDFSSSMDSHSKSTSSWSATLRPYNGGKAWSYSGGAWGQEKACTSGNAPHLWRRWKLNNVHEILKRDYQLRPVAIEIFSMDGCNDLLVFHKKEREEIFKNLVAMNLPRNTMLDTTISGSMKQESNEGSRLFKLSAQSFTKRWQNGEISNFQYLMHLNTLAGRGYSDLTQYPVFPWILADYESEELDLSNPKTFRTLNKPMGCQTLEGEDEFKKRYESWDDPEVPKFHYGSHYSSAGIVLFYLLRLPPFSSENQKLQGGQFDHADRLFNSIRDTWLSASGKGNTSDVKELIPEFYYMPEFLENRFNLDLGEKQSGEKVDDIILPLWAKGSAREFIRKHREALESDYVSENLHHWIDLIFGYKQRGKAAEQAVNVFYHYTYEGSVDIDAITDPTMKASILAQINHFGQTPKQLFFKPHLKRRSDRKFPPHLLKHSLLLIPREIRKVSSSISQILTFSDKILIAGPNNMLAPRTFIKYAAWGFPDLSLRFMSYDQDRLLSTHENLHGGNQIQCVSASHDGHTLVTGGDDGLLCVWRIYKDGPRALRKLHLEKALCGHTGKITCLRVSQPYMVIVSGSEDCSVIIWDLSNNSFIRQLPEFSSPVCSIYVNDLTGEILTGAGGMFSIWSINGDCLAVVNTSQLPSDFIVSLTCCTFSDWFETNWYVSGHQSGAVKIWKMVHCSSEESKKSGVSLSGGQSLPEYSLILHKVLKFHKYPVTGLYLTSDLKQFLSGDSGGHLVSWILPDESLRNSMNKG